MKEKSPSNNLSTVHSKTIAEVFNSGFKLFVSRREQSQTRADSGQNFTTVPEGGNGFYQCETCVTHIWLLKNISELVAATGQGWSRTESVLDLPVAETRCSVLSSWQRSQMSWRSRSSHLSRSVLQRTDKNIPITVDKATRHHRRLDTRMWATRESIGPIWWHGQHVLCDVDAQLLVQNHLMKLLVVFGVVHQHLNL